ncbi:MAG: branched-chain amino acid ABC transporter permease, partial [Planctomycetales bacterium]|nr:branched-chain amino acid ABC transporter permease [Planctomycetales bacterium]
MNWSWKQLLSFEPIALAVMLVYPLLTFLPASLGGQITTIFIFAILALALNVVMGSAGILHLGIAAFFGIGAYITGVLTVGAYPFQTGFTIALVASTVGASLAGVILCVPTLRLRGDYLALVTLGFGEVVRHALRNFVEITGGTQSLNPIPQPAWFGWDWSTDYRPFYYLCLLILTLVVVLLYNLDRSRLGRAWNAIREDELAATCMGINAGQVKLLAFAVGAGLAGLAGCLFATAVRSTAGPDAFDFNRSIIIMCCVI